MIHSNVAGLIPKHEAEHAANGDPVLSPSQLTTYLMCPRKWAARYLHGQVEPMYPAAAAGQRMHKVLEDYYSFAIKAGAWKWTGTVPSSATPEGTWALALITKTGLPKPGPGVIPERKFKFEHEGVWWRGSKDLTYTRDDVQIVRDHKSTSQLNPLWMKGEEELRTDPQSVIYAWEEYMVQERNVRNEWGYVTRHAHPQTMLTGVDMPFEAVNAAMQAHTTSGKRMLELYREKPDLNALPATGATNGGCEAFGGCKVQGCDVTALDKIKGLQLFNKVKKEKTDMSTYLEQMAAKKAAKAALAQPPNTETDATASLPHPMDDPPPAPPTVRERLARVVAVTTDAVPELAMGVNPAPFTPPVTPSAAPPATSAPVPAKRGRGRPRADAAAPAPTVEQRIAAGEVFGTAAPAPAPVGPGPFGPKYVSPTVNGYILCINCCPQGAHDVVLFTRYVALVHDALKEQGHEWYPLESFTGTALYQAALIQALEQTPPSGYLVVDSRTNEGRDALAILERNATLVVRGF